MEVQPPPQNLPWGINLRFDGTSLDIVLDSVKEELASQKFEQISHSIFWYVGRKVEQVQVWLIVDNTTFCGRYEIEQLAELTRQFSNGMWVCRMLGGWLLQEGVFRRFFQCRLSSFDRRQSKEAVQSS